jgi:hypothetical protein
VASGQLPARFGPALAPVIFYIDLSINIMACSGRTVCGISGDSPSICPRGNLAQRPATAGATMTAHEWKRALLHQRICEIRTVPFTLRHNDYKNYGEPDARTCELIRKAIRCHEDDDLERCEHWSEDRL